MVALRKESVDRNFLVLSPWGAGGVALRKESVDRNFRYARRHFQVIEVALRKESVDRNCPTCQWRRSVKLSLSARRAWIEILPCCTGTTSAKVALRKESVDRNRGGDTHANRYYVGSLSARRAWIEIIMFVNLRVVDGCRSPQGERG